MNAQVGLPAANPGSPYLKSGDARAPLKPIYAPAHGLAKAGRAAADPES